MRTVARQGAGREAVRWSSIPPSGFSQKSLPEVFRWFSEVLQRGIASTPDFGVRGFSQEDQNLADSHL